MATNYHHYHRRHHKGDLDCFVGEDRGATHFYENKLYENSKWKFGGELANYPGYGCLGDKNHWTKKDLSLEACQEACVAEAECKSIDWSVMGKTRGKQTPSHQHSSCSSENKNADGLLCSPTESAPDTDQRSFSFFFFLPFFPLLLLVHEHTYVLGWCHHIPIGTMVLVHREPAIPALCLAQPRVD